MSFLFYKFNTIPLAIRSLAGIIIATPLIASGCTTVTTQSFQRTKNSNAEASYVPTDADFGRYSQLRGEDMGIFFPERSPISEDDLQRILNCSASYSSHRNITDCFIGINVTSPTFGPQADLCR